MWGYKWFWLSYWGFWNVNLTFQKAFVAWNSSHEDNFSCSRVKLNALCSVLVAWALAMRFSFTCCVASGWLVVSNARGTRDMLMLCCLQHSAMIFRAEAAVWNIFAPVLCLSEAFSACLSRGVSACSILRLFSCQSSWMLEESALHPTSPFLFGKGSATSKHDKLNLKFEFIKIPDFIG